MMDVLLPVIIKEMNISIHSKKSKQCVANASFALMLSIKECLSTWTTEKLDRILHAGNTLCRNVETPG